MGNQTGVVAVSPNIEGEITSCKIENEVVNIDKTSAFSITQIKTYRSYDVCTKQTINEYPIQEFTAFSGFSLIFGAILLVIMLAIIVD